MNESDIKIILEWQRVWIIFRYLIWLNSIKILYIIRFMILNLNISILQWFGLNSKFIYQEIVILFIYINN